MRDRIAQIHKEVIEYSTDTPEKLEEFRIKFLVKKGLITELFNRLKEVPADQKREIGALVNELRALAEEKFNNSKLKIDESKETKGESKFDFTLPVVEHKIGSRHPISIVKSEFLRIFGRMGYSVSDGPEIEDDWHNFTALNFPPDHPAREMQDTFFISRNPDIALRTHTSSVQVRVMESQKPPIRTLSPGRVYRNEAISARAHCFFHQVEGLYIDENVSFKDLKQTLYHFTKEMFGKETKIRFRPSFFPFTEPSAEIDISCLICKGKGCPVCKYTGWVEIGGSGMVHPNVLKNNKIDSKKYTGFAFGMGMERIAMLKYGIPDLRLFSENDVRFIRQFSHLT